MINPGSVAAICVVGVCGDPCGAMHWTNTVLNVKKCMCWYLSITELKLYLIQ